MLQHDTMQPLQVCRHCSCRVQHRLVLLMRLCGSSGWGLLWLRLLALLLPGSLCMLLLLLLVLNPVLLGLLSVGSLVLLVLLPWHSCQHEGCQALTMQVPLLQPCRGWWCCCVQPVTVLP